MKKLLLFMTLLTLAGSQDVRANSYIPTTVKEINGTTILYMDGSNSDASGDLATAISDKWVEIPSKGFNSKKSATDSDFSIDGTQNSSCLQVKTDGGVLNSAKRCIHLLVKGITGVKAIGNANDGQGFQIGATEYTSGMSESTTVNVVAGNTSAQNPVSCSGLDKEKTYIITVFAYDKNATSSSASTTYLRAIRLESTATSVIFTNTTATTNLPLNGNIELQANIDVNPGTNGVSVGLYTKSEFNNNNKNNNKCTSYSIDESNKKSVSINYEGLQYGETYTLEVWENSFVSTASADVKNATQTFEFTTPTLEAPVFSPTPGTVTEGTLITCKSATVGQGVKVRYTTDGNEPSASSPEFPSGGIAISANTTFKAATFYSNNSIEQHSATVTANYTVGKVNLTKLGAINLDDVCLHNETDNTNKFVNSATFEYNNSYNLLRLKMEIVPDWNLLGDDISFTVTSSDPSVISAEVAAVYKAKTANERIYIGYLKVLKAGTTTISVKFNGSSKYNAWNEAITQEFTVTDTETITNISYSSTETETVGENSYPVLQLNTGGQSGQLDLSVTPDTETAKEKVREGVSYTWKRLTVSESESKNSNSKLISLDEKTGIVTTSTHVGRALVTATYTTEQGTTLTASYVVKVSTNTEGMYFKYGDTPVFDMYDNSNNTAGSKGTYHNPLVNIKDKKGWSSSDTSVATIDSDGKLNILSAGVTTVTVTFGSDSQTKSYVLTVRDNKQTYVVPNLYTPKVGDVVNVPGLTMTWGGFTTNFGDGSSHKYVRETEEGKEDLTDEFKESGPDESCFDNDNYFFSSGGQDPRHESTKYSGNIRGWERIRENKNDYLSQNVPTYGSFFKFEPDVDGLLTVDVLQTGSIQDRGDSKTTKNAYKWWKTDMSEGVINQWNYKALYLTDERGLSVKAEKPTSLSVYQHPYKYDWDGYKSNHSSETDFVDLTQEQINRLSLRPFIVGKNYNDENNAGLENNATISNYAYLFTYGATTANDGTTIEGESESSPEKIKKEMAKAFDLSSNEPTETDYEEQLKLGNAVHIMENDNHGYWTLTKSHNRYPFKVKAGKTYFLYTDGSKLSLGKFNFEPDNSKENQLEINGADSETAVTSWSGELNNCTVTLNRKIIKDQPNSLMLPFSMSVRKVKEVFGEGTRVLHVKSIDQVIHFVRHHHQMIVAGEPCIIYPTFTDKDGNTFAGMQVDDKNRNYFSSFTISGVTVEDHNLLNRYVNVKSNDGIYEFKGCFGKETMPIGSYYVSANNGGKTSQGQDIYIYRVNSADWMSNTRAFFKNVSGNASAQLMNASMFNAIDEDNFEDNINNIVLMQTENQPTAKTTEGIYNLSGQKMEGTNLPKGIYIVNGRKVVIK